MFTPIRNDVKLLFEIGVNRGGSVKAFTEFFPNALIVGIDINPECFFEGNRIKIEIGNASDESFVIPLISRYGFPDIVIDDGSHFSSDINKSYELLHKYVKKFYVIEDLSTQFSEFGNGFYINDGSAATNIIHKEINILLFKSMEWKSFHIYNSICFMKK